MKIGSSLVALKQIGEILPTVLARLGVGDVQAEESEDQCLRCS